MIINDKATAVNALDIAISCLQAGLSTIPIKPDGTKSPAVAWKEYQSRIANDAEVLQWFSDTGHGIAVVGGKVSGWLEIIDFDLASLIKLWSDRCLQAGLDRDLLKKLPLVKSPRGWHLYYRCPEHVEGNKKLAQRQDADGKLQTLIETRGEGGYCILPGSPAGCHPDGKEYVLKSGSLSDIPIITAEQRQIMLDVAASFNDHFTEAYTPKAEKDHNSNGTRPGDDFNLRADWRQDILLPAGCRELYSRGEESYWAKPGSSSRAPHATLNWKGIDKLYVFSSCFPGLEPMRAYDKYGAYTCLLCDGDFVKAAQELAKKGYGTPVKDLSRQSDRGKIKDSSLSPEQIEAKLEVEITQALADLGDPLLTHDIDAPIITEDFLPTPFKEYAIAVRESTQTPVGAAGLLMLAILATCLQKKFVVAPYNDNYIEPLVKWILIVLPPGERKTAILMSLLAPIAEWEKERAIALADEINKNTIARDVTQGRIEALKKQAINTESTKERQEIESEIADLMMNMPEEMRAFQKYTGSVTAESLEDLLLEQNEAMSILSDEGDGLFEIITGLYSKGKSNIDIFLKAFSCAPHKVRRQKRKPDLKAPAVSQGITIQPTVLEQLGVGNKQKLRGIGALARYDYYVPKGMIGTRKPRKRVSIPADTDKKYSEAIKSLIDIEIPEMPATLILAKDALEKWVQFQEWLEPMMAPFGDYGSIADWAAKAAGGAVRTAGILHAAKHKGENNVIPLDTIKKVITVSKKLLMHALKGLGALGRNQTIADAKWALSWIVQKAEKDQHARWFFKENDLHLTNRFKNDPKKRLNEALDILHGWSIVTKTIKLNRRKPMLVRYVHADLFADEEKIKSTLSTLSSLSKDLKNDEDTAEVTV